jgi:hypothetical protein
MYRFTLVPGHHAGNLSDSPTAPSQASRAERPVITWITTRTIPNRNRIQEIWPRPRTPRRDSGHRQSRRPPGTPVVVEHGSLLSMECERESSSPLEHGRSPGRLHQQAMTKGMQPFRETLASERRRLRNRSRRDRSGSVRDKTVSGASHWTISPWAQCSTGVKQYNVCCAPLKM